jgi:hypothetical protein
MSCSRWITAAWVGCLSAGVAAAGNISFTGTFSQDDQMAVFLFSAPSVNTIVRTWGFAGGVNAMGSAIPAGGFNPFISIFDTTATGGALTALSPLLDTNDDGPACPVNTPNCVSTDPSDGNAFDALLAESALNAGGSYAVVLTQSGNVPNGLTFGDGFSEQGQGNYTTGLGCFSNQPFCAGFFDQRNGNWALDITGVGSAVEVSLPEPGSLGMLMLGMSALGLIRRRRRR